MYFVPLCRTRAARCLGDDEVSWRGEGEGEARRGPGRGEEAAPRGAPRGGGAVRRRGGSAAWAGHFVFLMDKC